jgi:hypothetical protein
MSARLIFVMTLSMSISCGDDSTATKDQSVSVDQGGSVDQGAASDQGEEPDLGLDPDAAADAAVADVAVADAPVTTTDAKTTWPPPTPYHKGKQCTLPACDPKAKETTDLSGKWTQKVTTNSQTCNQLVRAMKPQLQKGHVDTLTGQTFVRAGECIYKNKVGGTVVGVIKGNVMITCEVLPPDTGVTPLVESQITFSGATGTGPAWTYLFDVPLPPSSCQANCTVDFKKE